MKTKKPAAVPDWLEQAFRDAGEVRPNNADEDDDCPICRAMRANTDPSQVETIDLGNGAILEIVAVTKPDAAT